jgi:hypothetical protein
MVTQFPSDGSAETRSIVGAYAHAAGKMLHSRAKARRQLGTCQPELW